MPPACDALTVARLVLRVKGEDLCVVLRLLDRMPTVTEPELKRRNS